MQEKERKQENFIKLYRDVIHAIGLDNAIVLGQLIGAKEMHEDKNLTGEFWQTNDQIIYYTRLSKKKVRDSLDFLEKNKLIEVNRHGHLNKNYYRINEYNLNYIHYVDNKISQDKIKVNKKFERKELPVDWYEGYINGTFEVISYEPKLETNTNRPFEIFVDSGLNKQLKDFFSNLDSAEKKSIHRELETSFNVRIFISTFLSVFKVMKPKEKIKKPKDFNSSKKLISNVEKVLSVAKLQSKDYENDDAYIRTVLEVWKWLFQNTDKILNNIETSKNIKCDYSIFLYTNKTKWRDIFGYTNWVGLALRNLEL